MSIETLSSKQAISLLLDSQKLSAINPSKTGKSSTLKTIQHLGYVQIDSISVIERAHHHCLWARDPSYRPEYLQQLQSDKNIFEYWSHAASYLPIEHFRYCLPMMNKIASGEKHWFDRNLKLMKQVLERIKEEGPLQAKDFIHKRNNKTGWWDWKPAKKALEQLFMEGKLMVSERKNFHKIYDLTERVLPNNIDLTIPNDEEHYRFLIQTYLRAQGFANSSEICYLKKGVKPKLQQVLINMLEQAELKQVELNQQKYYCLPELLELINTQEPSEKTKIQNNLKILSPFDNLVIQRNRLKQIFDYDYQIECYVPAAKRKFGYFCLPVLWRDKFIGRMDVKADRKNQVMIVKNFSIEQKIKAPSTFVKILVNELKKFMRFNRCEQIVIECVSDKEVGRRLLVEFSGDLF